MSSEYASSSAGAAVPDLHFVDSEIVQMEHGTFMWVDVKRFGFADASDHLLLAALIESAVYGHHYASPFDPHTHVDAGVHGRWRRDAIGVDNFVSIDPSDAIRRLQEWATRQPWTDPAYVPSTHMLDPVADVLRSGTVYRLVPPSNAEHEFGWVVGGLGFHEFVVIDRESCMMHLIVAADD